MINPNQETNDVDLNTATEGQLLHVEGLNLDRVRVLMRSRPFDNFNELRYLEGFTETFIKQLQKSGARLSKGHLANS
jgi:hypothetical protein